MFHPPYRGRIIGYNDEILSRNKMSFSLMVDIELWRSWPQKEESLNLLIQRMNLESERVFQRVASSIQNRRFGYFLLADKLNFSQVAKVESERYLWPFVRLVDGQSRKYIEDPIWGHVLGYVGTPLVDIEDEGILLVGKEGLERVL